MRIRIWHKLALTLVITTLIVLVLTVLLSRWYFDRGFLGYLNEIQNQRIELLNSRLIEQYADHGNWQFLRGNRHIWRRILIETLPAHTSKNRPPPRHFKFAPYLGVIDTNNNLVIGRVKNPDPSFNRPLIVDNKTIGYLHVEPFNRLTNELDRRFAKGQNNALLLIALLTLFCSIFIAWLLSRYFRKRIAQLTGIAHELTAGNFDLQINIQHKDELGDLGQDINHLARTLKKNSQSQKRWIADISHELRTPLAILKGELEALEDGVRPLDYTAVNSLAAEVSHLNKLVDDLFQLSLSDLGALLYSKEILNPVTILNDVIASFAVRFQECNLIVESLCDKENVPLILADEQRLFQLFSNLLENSARYTHAGGQIKISCTTGENFIISIEDSAPTVADKDLPHLFDRLHRVDDSRNRSQGGAGLGLSIAHEIMIAHNGSISVSSSTLGGLIIALTFPLSGRLENG